MEKKDLSFGEIIKNQRKSKNMYQYQLGELIGKTQAHIHHIETGVAFPFNPACEKIAEILELDKKELLIKLEIDRDISQIRKLCNRLIRNNVSISNIFKEYID